jgi:hypothetical protein
LALELATATRWLRYLRDRGAPLKCGPERIKVRAEQGVDVEGSRKLAWPEWLVIPAKYRGLDESLELRGAALVQHDPPRIGPI